jgi:hypothetical protein
VWTASTPGTARRRKAVAADLLGRDHHERGYIESRRDELEEDRRLAADRPESIGPPDRTGSIGHTRHRGFALLNV